MDSTIRQLTQILEERGLASKRSLVGCTFEDIQTLQQSSTLPLPGVYCEFLRTMGRGAGRFFCGSKIYYPTILGLTEVAQEVIADDPVHLSLPPDAFVFTTHQGYEFLYFRTSEGDDPPVYYYIEDSGQFVKRYDHLSEYLLAAAFDDW